MGKVLNKRGQSIEDGFLMIIILFALAIGGLVATYSYNQLFDKFQATEAFNQSDEVMAAFEGGKEVNALWDYIILMVLIGFALTVVIIGFFVDVHSIFFPIFVIVMVLGVGVAMVIDHTWTQVSTQTTFGTLAQDSMPITNHILGNMPMYYVIISVLSMIALYAKTRQDEG